MKYFSMFSGVGGFDLALNRQGNNCIGYSEIDKIAIKTYKKNFGEEVINYGDATTINTNELPDFDLLCGGFPCQPFSQSGNRRGFEDTRGTLFFEIARILEAKRPSYFILENVEGLLNHNKGETCFAIFKTLWELGYSFEWMVIDSYFFSASTRKRIYLCGYNRNSKADAWKGIKQTLPLYTMFSERIRDKRKEDFEETGRSSARIIRTFAKLPDWMDSWDSVYTEEKANG